MASKRVSSLSLFCVILLLSGSALAGSVAAPSEQPVAFTRAVHSMGLAAPVIPDPVDLPAVLQEDQQRQQNGGSYRFAISRTVKITPQNAGMWEDLDANTVLWRIPIISPGALSLSLGFSRYHMPAGGKLFLYSDDHRQVLGPFTSGDNREHGELWTPILPCDSLIVELTIPLVEVPQLELELTCINHGYRGFGLSLEYQALGEAGWCNRSNNAACFEADWRDQIRSVGLCHVTVGGGTWEGTGTLLNNTAQNDIPYFLTAFHLFDEPRDGVLSTESETKADRSLVVYWNFHAASCAGTTGSLSQSQKGATLMAAYSSSDFVLVKLDNNPSAAFNVYYAGWDRSSDAPSSGVAIHHPQGDLKKISRTNSPLRKQPNTVSSGVPVGTTFVVDAWDFGTGVTEEGSSGGPFFSLPGKRVVGQLIGGRGSCDNPGPSGFGPLYRSWIEGGSPETRLSDWLDPLNTGAMSLAGKNPASAPALPSDLVEVAGAPYASLDGLAPGSKEAQDSQRQAVQRLGLPLEVKTRQTGIVFRLVPAGTFMMGSPSSEAQRYDDEGPQHQVTLTKPFYCGKVEVTQGQWWQVMRRNPAYYNSAGLDAPAEKVLWNDCQAFLKALCQMEGVPEGTYRFLTEAEWEYACRAGSTSAYCFGDTDSLLGQYAWYNGNSGQSHPVGQKKPNAFGLYDMHGNVWEWCQDWEGDYYAGAVTDPLGPRSGGNHILRGGSWHDHSGDCRSALRFWFTPVRGFTNVGLRFARTVPPSP